MNTWIFLALLCAVMRHSVGSENSLRRDLSFTDALKNLRTGDVIRMTEKYQENPDTTELSVEHKQAIADMLAYEEQQENGNGRKLQQKNVVEAFRNPVVSESWARIRAPYPSDSIERTSQFGGKDKIKVEKVGSICYIVGQETNEGSDWFENLSAGRLEIKDTNNGATIGYGFPGFVGPYNDVRVQIKNLINNKCGGTSSKRYVGYSRGGAIMQVVLYAHLKAGITTASKSTLVTFGSPRSLLESESNFVHNALGSRGHRVVNQGDPVPSVPPGWFGGFYGSYFTHVGQNAYGLSRNGPTFFTRFNFARHTQYDPSFASLASAGEEQEVAEVKYSQQQVAIFGAVGGGLLAVAAALVGVTYRRARAAEKLASELESYMQTGRSSSRMSSFTPSRQSSMASVRQSSVSSLFRKKDLPLATANPLSTQL